MGNKPRRQPSLAATHENYSPEWFTPDPWWEWIYRTLGTRDVFDPCPSFWQEHQGSGLDVAWQSPVYCNHPGEKRSTPPSSQLWWSKCIAERAINGPIDVVWALFSIEHLRYMRPSPLRLDGYLILPDTRIQWTWGGPTMTPKNGKPRVHGQPQKGPGNWSAFWSSVKPDRDTPAPCEFFRTGPERIV